MAFQNKLKIYTYNPNRSKELLRKGGIAESNLIFMKKSHNLKRDLPKNLCQNMKSALVSNPFQSQTFLPLFVLTMSNIVFLIIKLHEMFEKSQNKYFLLLLIINTAVPVGSFSLMILQYRLVRRKKISKAFEKILLAIHVFRKD